MCTKENYFYSVNQVKPNPFLSIVTSRLQGKRQQLYQQHVESIQRLEPDYEQIFIIDPEGYGMLCANSSFVHAKELISGEWVYLLDDDDFITDPRFILVLKENSSNTDIIFFKNKILNGDGDQIFPKPESWESRTPKLSQIGGSCFAFRKWIYLQYIHHFAYASCGDWYFITEVLKNESVKTKWLDRLMFETGRVSFGGE